MARVALITGGADGIGRVVSLKLAAERILVVIADRDEKAADTQSDSRFTTEEGMSELV